MFSSVHVSNNCSSSVPTVLHTCILCNGAIILSVCVRPTIIFTDGVFVVCTCSALLILCYTEYNCFRLFYVLCLLLFIDIVIILCMIFFASGLVCI